MARERRVDVLTCAGDLYEQERFVPDTANFLVSAFAGLQSIPVLLAPGNHDWLDPASIYATAKWSPNVFVFHEDRLSAFELRARADAFGEPLTALRPTPTTFFRIFTRIRPASTLAFSTHQKARGFVSKAKVNNRTRPSQQTRSPAPDSRMHCSAITTHQSTAATILTPGTQNRSRSGRQANGALCSWKLTMTAQLHASGFGSHKQ